MKTETLKVTQRCCEWMAVLGMANMLVSNSFQLAKVYDEREMITFGMALTQLEKSTPEKYCNVSFAVVFTDEHLELLLRLVDWFDDYFLSHQEILLRIDEEGYLKKYAQVGLVKRNLLSYEEIPNPANEGAV